MPPHLHPRSRLTSSLFATTLFFSFFVVGLPHVLPCPAPRIAFADGESPDGQPQRRRRRRKCVENEGERREASAVEEISEERESTNMARIQGPKPKRACPVPKPGGLMGELLGFNLSSSDGDGKGSKPP